MVQLEHTSCINQQQSGILMTKAVFITAADGSNKNFYSIYEDIHGTKWIKFWGKFLRNGYRQSHPWKMQEYFGADFRLEDFLCVPAQIVAESLTEIRETIGDMTDEEALQDMQQFYTRFCYPPIEGEIVELPIDDLTIDTPCGLYIE